MRLLLAPAAAALLLAAAARAAQPGPPPYQQLRYDEDWSYLRDPAHRLGWADRIKFIPFDAQGESFISLGGEIRQRYEYFSRADWGSGPQDPDGHWLQRYMAHADLRFGSFLRAFAQLKSGLAVGRGGGPRPPDEDQIDLNQAFVDLSPLPRLVLRAGRQEMSYGSSRLVSVREGPNVRQSFEGARVTAGTEDLRLDLFGTRPVETNRGVFDDHEDLTRSLWGAYGVAGLPWLAKSGVDLYLFRYADDRARFDQGSEKELRHSLGTRLWGRGEALDYNFEFVYQWGRYGPGRIAAWTAASDTGYTLRGAPGAPRLGLRADATSGDRDPSDHGLQTFNAMFPRGAYFGEIALIGPYNHVDLHPAVEWHLPRDVALTVECALFWRQSLEDGVYNPSGALLRTGRRSRARFIGTQPAAQASWQVDRHLSITGVYARFFAGAFLRESPPARDIDYFSTYATYKF